MNVRPLIPENVTTTCDAKGPEPLQVTAIGSCRVLGPLRRNAGSIYQLNQAGNYGYCHSSAEALQQLRVLQGEITLPEHLRPVVAPSIAGGPIDAAGHLPSDIYFVELSSAKNLTVDGIFVQLNYLTRHFADFFADRDRARSFWRLARAGETCALETYLRSDAAFKALSQEDQEILRSTRLEMASTESLTRDLGEIAARLSDSIFVTHFDAQKSDGTLLHARAEYLRMTRAVLEDLGLTYYDPTALVRRLGQATALEDAAASLSHYAAEFEERLGRHWMKRFIVKRAHGRKPGVESTSDLAEIA